MHNRLLTKLAISAIFLVLFFSVASAATIVTDKMGNVFAVIDGKSFQLSSGETIQLANIVTPASGQAGYSESKNYLTSLIQGKTVYLDTGVTAETEQGRLLCVVYLDYNETHYENVNMAMIQNGYAAPSNSIINEFNPASWTWFVAKQNPTENPTQNPHSTATPTPTTFSQPSPVVSPTIPEFSVFSVLLLVGSTTILVMAQIYKKEKKLR
jgi:endonuclease YncB( thermonuclease family)